MNWSSVFVLALVFLGLTSGKSVHKQKKEAEGESAVVSSLEGYVHSVDSRLDQVEAFESRLGAVEQFESRIGALEQLESRVVALEGLQSAVETLETRLTGLESGTHVDKVGCCIDSACRNYRGFIHTTENGHECQRWDSDEVHQNNYMDPESKPNQGLEANFCRNPDSNHNGGVWCYTTDASVRWEKCNVPMC